jgi:hypothetical protein
MAPAKRTVDRKRRSHEVGDISNVRGFRALRHNSRMHPYFIMESRKKTALPDALMKSKRAGVTYPFLLEGGAVKNMPADKATLSANTIDIHAQCSLGMDQAIGIEKKKASWFAPVGKLLKAAAQTIGFCVEMRRSWLSLLAPHALAHVSTVASNSSSQSQPSPDELAYSMDIAIGPQHVAAPRSTVATSSVRRAQPQPTPDELAYCMDIAIGERFTVSSSTVMSSSGGQEATTELPESGNDLAMAATAGS